MQNLSIKSLILFDVCFLFGFGLLGLNLRYSELHASTSINQTIVQIVLNLIGAYIFSLYFRLNQKSYKSKTGNAWFLFLFLIFSFAVILQNYVQPLVLLNNLLERVF